MQQRILASVIATLAASKGALADFQVYLGTTNEINNPGTSFSASAMQVHDHSPLGCSDVDGMVSLSNPNDNDASSGGWACDGCNQDAVRDWDIERFEMYNGDDAVGAVTDDPFPLFDRATGAVTLRQNDDGGYTAVDQDNNEVGTCSRPADPQEMDCSQVISATFLTHAFDCTSDLSPNERLGE